MLVYTIINLITFFLFFLLLQDHKSATCFLLHCQKFIELIWV
ncbi:hypothetical protein TorRG33x02_286830 [Trema orientale]|uniref:Uncharacterized protein n=1 Tax=Trema orientale TaxID=63057 RepID=A0A2P5CFB6_TREOI|nr:hypothetical protein TorRG33x02_286830 [Trema orientale]